LRRRPPSEWGDAHAGVPLELWADTDAADVVAWIRATMLPPGGGVLDCGVGTGRVAVPLLAAGFKVLGLDASEKMLALARSAGVTCKRADLGTRWPTIGRWHAILMCSNVVGQLETQTRQRHALYQARRRALRVETLLAVQTHFPTPYAIDRWRAGGGDVDEATQLVRSRATWPDGEHVQQWRYLHPAQLIDLAKSVGWGFVSLASDFRGAPLVSGSPQYVAIFEAA